MCVWRSTVYEYKQTRQIVSCYDYQIPLPANSIFLTLKCCVFVDFLILMLLFQYLLLGTNAPNLIFPANCFLILWAI